MSSPTSLRGRLARLRGKPIRPYLWTVALGGLSLCAALGGANLYVLLSARGRTYRRAGDVPLRPIAIVPGAMVWGPRPSDVLEDRLATALDLYRAGRVERVLVSGDHSEGDYDEVNIMRNWLVEHGVPSEAIFMDHAGLRTLDTMFRARYVFQVEGAIVCTQRFHLARALMLARAAGIDAVGLIADRRRYRHEGYNELREAVARLIAVSDAYVVHRQPRFYGPVIPWSSDARLTHDAATR